MIGIYAFIRSFFEVTIGIYWVSVKKEEDKLTFLAWLKL